MANVTASDTVHLTHSLVHGKCRFKMHKSRHQQIQKYLHNCNHKAMTLQRAQCTNEAEMKGGMCDPVHTYDEIVTRFSLISQSKFESVETDDSDTL